MDRSEFWATTNRTPHGCWEWLGKLDKDGYGSVTVQGMRPYGTRAHRIAYVLALGDPRGKVVRHGCDNPKCIRPCHLTLGTQAENVQDMHDRGRYRGGGSPWEFCKKGLHRMSETRITWGAGQGCNECRKTYRREHER